MKISYISVATLFLINVKIIILSNELFLFCFLRLFIIKVCVGSKKNTAGKMSKWLEALAALAEDSGLVLSHMAHNSL